MATIHDVAKACGVSPATVSFVLNNGPRPVNAETRARVLEAMRRLNYQPNAAARGLARRRLNNLGILFGDVESRVVTNLYVSTLLGGIFYQAELADYDVLLVTKTWPRLQTVADQLRDRRSDGYIIITPPLDGQMTATMAEMNLPFVAIAGEPPDATNRMRVCLDTDHTAGVQKAIAHLRNLGHRRIAHISGTANQYSVKARRQAFIDNMEASGLEIYPGYLQAGSFDRAYVIDNYRAAHCLLSLPEPPTAVFCANDGIATILQEVALSRGFRVPEDLSIVGFDDLPGTSVAAPVLTTLRQPLESIGREATALLLKLLENPEYPVTYRLFTPELVVRHSTTAPRTAPRSQAVPS